MTFRRGFATVLSLLALSTQAVWAQPSGPRAAARPPAGLASSSIAGSMGEAVDSPLDRLNAALQQIGMTTCAGTVQRASSFLFEDGVANFTVQPLGPDANKWPVVITMETHHQTAGRSRFTTLIVAPGPTCSGFYQQTIEWLAPCQELKTSVFANYKDFKLLFQTVQVGELSPAVQVYLIPAGTGCTSVKKELFH